MGEAIKDRIILILGVLSVLFFLGMAKSCSDSYMHKKLMDKEMVRRLDLEEKIDKISRDKVSESDKLKGLNEELQAQKKAREQAEKSLTEQQQAMQALKAELDKVNKEKEAPPEKKEAAVNP